MIGVDFNFINGLSILQVGIAIAFLLAGIILGKISSRSVSRLGMELARHTSFASDDQIVNFSSKLLSYTLYIIGLMMALTVLNIDISPILAGFGVLSIGIAFAAKDTLSNLISGFFIYMDRPFAIGDRILLPKAIGGDYGKWGDVIDIGFRTTKIRSTDGVLMLVPNAMIASDVIVNFSHVAEPALRVRVRLGLELNWENIRRAMELVEKIAEEDPGVYLGGGKKPQVVLRNIREYDVLIELRFYVDTPKKMRITKSKIIAQIIKEFEKEKIEFSTPRVIYRQE